MRYPLQIREIQGSKRIILPVLSRQPRCYGNFEAIIDTGSPRTIIGAGDAEKLRIPYHSLKESVSLIGFGRGSMPTLLVEKFIIVIKSEDGTSKNLSIQVSIPNVPLLRKTDQNMLKHAFTLPTIIGLDFLEFNNLKLFIDIIKNVAYLEN